MKMTEAPDRPRLTITPGYWDQVMDVAVWVLLIVMIAFTGYVYSTPAITSDVRFVGIILAGIGSITCVGFHFLKKYPHRFNYLVRITFENAARQYTLALRMMRMINLIMLIEFIAVFTSVYVEEMKGIQVDEGLIVVSVMILGFLPLGYYLWKSSGKR